MKSGRSALHEIDASIVEARNALSNLGHASTTRARRLSQIGAEESAAYDALAAIRLDMIQSGDDLNELRADTKARKLISSYDDSLAEIESALEKAADKLSTLESRRRDKENALDLTVRKQDEATKELYASLETDPEYQQRANALEEATATAERARAKLSLAESDKKEKGAPYENDPLFEYLYRRNFGGKDYRAFFLFAALDRWVARLINYRDAKLNYNRLLELPIRLAEHAERVEEAADDIANSIEAYEQDALNNSGVAQLRDAATAAQKELDAIDAEIVAAEERHREIAAQHSAVASGDIGPLAEARTVIARALTDKSIPDLKVLAAETLTLEDDRIVSELITLRRERFEIEETARTAHRAQIKQSDILSELERLRRKFKSARFDSPYSEFSDSGVVGLVLTEVLRGVLSHNQAWRRLSRAQRTRRRTWSDDFGGETWRGPMGTPKDWRRSRHQFPGSGFPSGGRRRPRPPRIPRMPRAPRTPRGGGGFKTGGGF